MTVPGALDRFFAAGEPLGAGPILVAFSGGPDSTALLAGLAARRRHDPSASDLYAAHLDHAADPGSAERARKATVLAARLGVPCRVERRDVSALRSPGESWETAARRVRYEFLEAARRTCGARWIATAHHLDDQAETVLLRWLRGSGLAGLAGIRPRNSRLIRPLLALPKAEILAYLEALGLPWQFDPANLDLAVARNRIRHRLLPALEAREPDLSHRLARLAEGAARASASIASRLSRRFPGLAEAEEPSLDLAGFRELPPELRPYALAALHRAAGLPFPPSRAAGSELERRIDAGRLGGSARVACGGGASWTTVRGRIALAASGSDGDPSEAPGFTYTFSVPGRIEIPEIGMALTLRPGEPAAWMLEGAPNRAGLALVLAPGDRVTVRSRRPGDRLHPLGAAGTRKLKEILIDRQVPRGVRKRIPLLCAGDRIVWVPGVTIEERCRVRSAHAPVWIAELQALAASDPQPTSNGNPERGGTPPNPGPVFPVGTRAQEAPASEVANP
ncbi:MAG TPA: tRNA lysidine(34) synthetase TilS [Thermoanaerobaculia bacterium]|nr:tRNA lysidine(34) synthetase TilS [Thermoanaerobaculia bacterium]